MIHILNESPYAEFVEEFTERLSKVLTQETRDAILRIKYFIPTEKKVDGIQIYKAVLKDGIRDVDSFWIWKEQNPNERAGSPPVRFSH